MKTAEPSSSKIRKQNLLNLRITLARTERRTKSIKRRGASEFSFIAYQLDKECVLLTQSNYRDRFCYDDRSGARVITKQKRIAINTFRF